MRNRTQISDPYEVGASCTAAVLWRRKKYFDIFRKTPSVGLYLFVVKFDTKSSVFLNTALKYSCTFV